MIDRIVIYLTFLIVLLLLFKWTYQKVDESAYDDYSNSKPPFYVYFNTSGIQYSMIQYFAVAALISFICSILFERLTDNVYAACLVMLIGMQLFKQRIIISSIRNTQAIDYSAPGYLTFFGSVLRQVNDPIFALEHSAKHADPRYRKTLETLATRLRNGQDPELEIQKAKQFFRNRVLRNFLDDLGDHLTKGNVLNTTLDRLIERAQDRERYAIERKIETFAGVFVIYGGLVFEMAMVAILAAAQPDLLDVFLDTALGRFAVLVIVAISGLMILIAQRLILLSEG